MKPLAEWLEELRQADIRLEVDGERLRIDAPQGAVTPELRHELSARKAEIIAYLLAAPLAITEPLPPRPVPSIPADDESGLLRYASQDEASPAALSFAQQRLWFLDQLEGDRAAYNIFSAYRLLGALNIPALQASLDEIVRRHAALRTVYQLQDGQPLQIVRPPQPLPLPLQDLSGLPEEARQEAWLRLAREEELRPFDLVADLPLRASLLRLSPREHILLLNFHHIASDAWSIGIFWGELQALYSALHADPAADPGAVLPPLPLQYPAFAAWQRHWLQGERLQAQLDYWRARLQGLEPLALPLDRPRPPRQSFHGASFTIALPADLRNDLHALSRRYSASLYMTLLAAFKLLLARYSGSTNLAVGAPIANRSHAALEGLIGFFVNTLVIRTRLPAGAPFREYLGQVRQALLEAYEYQDLPFEKLVEELQPERDLSRNPLFQVLFTSHTEQIEAPLGEVQVQRLPLEVQRVRFDLEVHARETPEGLSFLWVYNTDLFDRASIEQMARHYAALLEVVRHDPSTPLERLPMLSPDETHRMLVEGNDTAVQMGEDAAIEAGEPPRSVRNLPRWVEWQAQRHPDQVALCYPEHPSPALGVEALTYRQLNTRANQLAYYLRDLGVGPDTLVGLYMERSLEAIVAILGILKAGGAYLPLDPSFPPARLETIIASARPPVILTGSNLPLPNLQPSTFQPALVNLDQVWPSIAACPETNPAPVVHPENLAYILYTSGSTGVPKGVAMPQRALINMIAWQLRQSHLPAGARTLQFTTLNFDVSFQEIFSTWAAGGTLVLVADETRRDPDRLLEYLAAQRIERLFLPFIALQSLAERAALAPSPSPKPGEGGEALAPSASPKGEEGGALAPGASPKLGEGGGLALREVITAGEQLQITPQLRRFFASLPGCTLHNHYGPTEAHVVTAYTLDPQTGVEHWPHLPPIGKPIANVGIYILDGELQPVPPGVVGDLYIGGAALAQGYYRRPDLTAERFIPHPYPPAPGARLYLTGDLARCRRDGEIEFLGRKDQQVKVRGYRVELGEIESLLRAHPAIDQAVVALQAPAAARSSPSTAEKILVAYLVAKSGQLAPSAAELRQHLKARLPDYMLPRHYLFLEALPLTPTGKVDRKSLPLPEAAASPDAAYKLPRDDLESQLCQLWAETLGVTRLGVEDNFFDLGGHSILAVRLFTRIEEMTGRRLPLSTLFEYPTVAGLAGALRQEGYRGRYASLVSLKPGGSKAPLFLVHNFGGEVINLQALASLIDPERPVYGLQAKGLDGKQPPHTDIPEMAAAYLEAVRSVQPHGPYFLGGYCFGGVVAYEMACQLEVQGEPTALVAAMDGYAPIHASDSTSPGRLRKALNFVRNLPYWLRDFAQMIPHERRVVVRRRLRMIWKGLEKRLGRQAELTPHDLIGEYHPWAADYHRQLMELHMAALMRYQPPPYGGTVSFLRVQAAPLFTYREPDGGWGRLARRVIVRYIAGAHHNLLMPPYVESLARELQEMLDEAQG